MVRKVRLIVERTSRGLQATIQERNDPATAEGPSLEVFSAESIQVAKQRASSVARKHGLTSYAFIDKTVVRSDRTS